MVVPATLPLVRSGVQIVLGQAIIGVLVAEITVPILATSTISILMVNVLRLLERGLMPYRFLGPRRRSTWQRLAAALGFGRRLPEA